MRNLTRRNVIEQQVSWLLYVEPNLDILVVEVVSNLLLLLLVTLVEIDKLERSRESNFWIPEWDRWARQQV